MGIKQTTNIVVTGLKCDFERGVSINVELSRVTIGLSEQIFYDVQMPVLCSAHQCRRSIKIWKIK